MGRNNMYTLFPVTDPQHRVSIRLQAAQFVVVILQTQSRKRMTLEVYVYAAIVAASSNGFDVYGTFWEAAKV